MAVRRPVVLASVLLSVALSVSACTSDPPPAAAPPSGTAAPVASSTPASPTTTSAPPTTTTPPVDPVLAKIPKAARANTQEGAEAFAKFFIEQVAASFVEADASLLDGLSEQGCTACDAYRDSALELRQQKHHHERPVLTVRGASATEFTDEAVVIAVPSVQNAVDVVDAHGTPVGSTDPDKGTFLVTLSWDDSWKVQGVQMEKLS